MRGTSSSHVAYRFATRISLGVVRPRLYSAVVAGLNAVRRSSRDAECKATCGNGQGQTPMFHLGFPFLALSALFGGHHVHIARHKGHLLASAFGTLRYHCFVLGDAFCALKLLPAFLATILVGRHGLESSNEPRRRVQNFTADGCLWEARPPLCFLVVISCDAIEVVRRDVR